MSFTNKNHNAENLSSFESKNSSLRKIFIVIFILLLVMAVSLPWLGGRSDMRLVSEFCYYLVLAQLWNLIAGYGGLVSIGQHAFVGLGGYAFFIFTVYLGVHPLAAILLSGVFALIFAIPSAYLLFRLYGAYFAVGTWVLAEVYRLGFAQVTTMGGGSGMSLPINIIKKLGDSKFDREMLLYFISLILALSVIASIYFVLRSSWGLALTAIRDSETAAESLGVKKRLIKYSVYLFAAFGAGMAGSIIYLNKLRISPDSAFSVSDWTVNIIFIVVIGGLGTLEGPIIGALIFFLLREILADFGSIYMIFLGIVAVIVMLKFPKGIWGFISSYFNIEIFPVRRKLLISKKGT